MGKKCSMWGRSYVKNPFWAQQIIIMLQNNNIGLNIYTFHLRKHCITFHSSFSLRCPGVRATETEGRMTYLKLPSESVAVERL